jgi:hypothetical protein
MMRGDGGFIFVVIAIGVMLVVAIIISIVDMRVRGESRQRVAFGTLFASVAVGGTIVAWALLGIIALALIIPIAVAIWSSERRRAVRSR